MTTTSQDVESDEPRTYAGHLTVTRASTVGQFNDALTSGPTIDGGVAYYGHGSQGTLYVGEGSAPETNVDSTNVNQLSGSNLGPNATVELVSCYSGTGGESSIAQQVANQVGAPTTGMTGGLSFTGTPGQPITGANALPPETGPIYMVPTSGNPPETFRPQPPPEEEDK